MANVSRACPICGTPETEVLLNLEMAVLNNAVLPGTFSVVACRGCGFVYQDSKATLDDYEQYYRVFNKYDASPTIDKETKELFLHYISIFLRFINKDKCILDMGCAGGVFLNLLKENGYTCLVGVDPSADSANYIKDRGIEAYAGGIYSNDMPFLEKRFDLIVLSGVMEHLFDLRKAIINLGKYLKDDGMIFISVPDVNRYCMYDNAMSYYFNLEHINHFSAVSLSNLMQEFSFRSIDTSFYEMRFGDSTVPAFSSLFRKEGVSSVRTEKDMTSAESVRKCLRRAEAKRADQIRTIDALLKSNEEIIIWGAGSVASMFLSGTNLGRCNIKWFVDKDPGKQGKVLAGITIRPPDSLRGVKGTIVVCAALYSYDILNEIRSMGLDNRVIFLK